jgi:SAM-dependent methyltransferase
MNHMDGFINVDKAPAAKPDQVVDLETLPWPFDNDCASEVVLNHVLEHLAATPELFLAIMQELYRVCRANAHVIIAVPHPRHDDFLTDPTHVRPILPETFQLFSKSANHQYAAKGIANTPLGLYLDVDFEIEAVNHTPDPLWQQMREEGTVTDEDITLAMYRENNVIKNVELRLRVIKT